MINKTTPKPPLMGVGCNDKPCPLCGNGMKAGWLWFKSKDCYQPLCENYGGINEID